MEELLVCAILLSEGFVAEDEYHKRLDELFLRIPENDDLLYLEWETDINKAVIYVRTHFDYTDSGSDPERFGRILMDRLKEVYENSPDIQYFAGRMYSLWQSLPVNIRKMEPFLTLCHADDPLSWGDEEQSRNMYERMLNYYHV